MGDTTDDQERQLLQAGPPARKSALNVEDDFSKYEVVSRTEILSILRGMLEHNSLISFHFNRGYDSLLTALLDISSDGKTLIFDYGGSIEMNRKLLQADKINCASSEDQVKIQFTLNGVRLVKHEGRDAFLGNVPASLIRLQRREFYRLTTPVVNPLVCSIPLPLDGGSVKKQQAVVVNIGGGGVALNVAPGDVNFKVGAQFSGASIDLPNAGLITFDTCVRNIYDISMPSGKIHQRAGCQFISLSRHAMTLIQRYIIQIERERKARGI
jgi:c-di-GMP-binding flagellar brake protein YcgR